MRGESMAKNKTENKTEGKANGKTRPMTKSAVVQHLADTTKQSKKQVNDVFDSLTALIKQQLGKKGPGMFTIPGLLKLKRVHKKATPERKGIHPFTKQETVFKGKPARNTVRARALKNLNDLIK